MEGKFIDLFDLVLYNPPFSAENACFSSFCPIFSCLATPAHGPVGDAAQAALGGHHVPQPHPGGPAPPGPASSVI